MQIRTILCNGFRKLSNYRSYTFYDNQKLCTLYVHSFALPLLFNKISMNNSFRRQRLSIEGLIHQILFLVLRIWGVLARLLHTTLNWLHSTHGFTVLLTKYISSQLGDIEHVTFWESCYAIFRDRGSLLVDISNSARICARIKVFLDLIKKMPQ